MQVFKSFVLEVESNSTPLLLVCLKKVRELPAFVLSLSKVDRLLMNNVVVVVVVVLCSMLCFRSCCAWFEQTLAKAGLQPTFDVCKEAQLTTKTFVSDRFFLSHLRRPLCVMIGGKWNLTKTTITNKKKKRRNEIHLRAVNTRTKRVICTSKAAT